MRLTGSDFADDRGIVAAMAQRHRDPNWGIVALVAVIHAIREAEKLAKLLAPNPSCGAQ